MPSSVELFLLYFFVSLGWFWESLLWNTFPMYGFEFKKLTVGRWNLALWIWILNVHHILWKRHRPFLLFFLNSLSQIICNNVYVLWLLFMETSPCKTDMLLFVQSSWFVSWAVIPRPLFMLYSGIHMCTLAFFCFHLSFSHVIFPKGCICFRFAVVVWLQKWISE